MPVSSVRSICIGNTPFPFLRHSLACPTYPFTLRTIFILHIRNGRYPRRDGPNYRSAPPPAACTRLFSPNLRRCHRSRVRHRDLAKPSRDRSIPVRNGGRRFFSPRAFSTRSEVCSVAAVATVKNSFESRRVAPKTSCAVKYI